MTRRRRGWLAALAALVLLAAGLTLVLPRAERRAAPRRASYPTGLAVRGSVGQLYVLNADAGAPVRVRGGPAHVDLARVTNRHGAGLVRGLAAGRYTVTVGGGHPATRTATVLGPEAHPPPGWYRDRLLPPHDGYLETRDGTLLSYRVDLPHRRPADGRHEVVVVYSGYRPALRPAEAWEEQLFRRLTSLGYAVVAVNMRGSGCSGGAFDVMEPLVGVDGYDVVESLHAQGWVDRVAMAGSSWLGLSQLFVAATRPPHLTAIAPGAVVGDFYRDTVYPGGILNIGFGLGWAAARDRTNADPSSYGNGGAFEGPARRLPAAPGTTCRKDQALRTENRNTVQAWKAHRNDDGYWAVRAAAVERITAPTLLVVSWQDEQVGSRPAGLLARFPRTTETHLVGTNGKHDAYLVGDVWSEVARFLRLHLGRPSPAERAASTRRAPVQILLDTTDAGRSRTRLEMAAYPAAAAGRRLAFGADLVADDPDPDGTTSSYRYRGDRLSDDEVPGDRASFTSAPLARTEVLAGSGLVDLRIRAQATDVDLQVTLWVVRPDGEEQPIQAGWVRASRGRGSARARPLTPGEWTDVRVDLFPFAQVVRAGSRLRVEVASPVRSRLSYVWGFDTLPGSFDVSIGNGPGLPSSLVLPVLAHPDVTGLRAALPSCTHTWNQPCRPAG